MQSTAAIKFMMLRDRCSMREGDPWFCPTRRCANATVLHTWNFSWKTALQEKVASSITVVYQYSRCQTSI